MLEKVDEKRTLDIRTIVTVMGLDEHKLKLAFTPNDPSHAWPLRPAAYEPHAGYPGSGSVKQ